MPQKLRNTDEPITREELELLQERVSEWGEADLSNSTSVQAVAEATGASAEEVLAALHRIRGERAFVPKLGKPRSISLFISLAVVGGALLGFVLFAFASGLWSLPIGASSEQLPVRTTPRARATHADEPRPAELAVTTGPGTPPDGVEIDVAGFYEVVIGQGQGQFQFLDVDVAREQVIQSLLELSKTAEHRELNADPNAPLVVRDHTGTTIKHQRGFVHYSIVGSYGTAGGYLPIARSQKEAPSAAKERERRVRLVIGGKFDRLYQSQMSTGFTPEMPPAGFSVTVAGRRKHEYKGAKLLFTVRDLEPVRKLLLSSIQTMLAKDQNPPEGAWSDSDQSAADIPTPTETLVTIVGPLETVDIMVATAPGAKYKSAADVAIAAKAQIAQGVDKAVAQLAKVNAQSGRPRP